MDGVVGTAVVLALLLMAGGAIGVARRESFSPRWLFVAAGLVLLNDFLLRRGFGMLPHLIPPTGWNWQGKVLRSPPPWRLHRCRPSVGRDRV
jgi:hypothetical protein